MGRNIVLCAPYPGRNPQIKLMKTFHTLFLAILSLFLVDALAPSAQAQKLAKEYFDMSEYGFKFKPLRDFNPIPVQKRNKDGGVIAKMEGKELQVPIKGQGVYPMNAEIQVYRFVPRKIGTVSTSDGDEEDIVIDESTLAEYVGMYYRGVNEEKVLLDKKEKINKNLTGPAPPVAGVGGRRDHGLLQNRCLDL